MKINNAELTPILRNNKFGFADGAGREVIPCWYEAVGFFSEGLCEVMNRKGRSGFIDETGRKVILCRYDWVSPNGFREGLCAVARRERNDVIMGFIDKTGKMVIRCSYDYLTDFENGLCRVQKDGIWHVIDKMGKEYIGHPIAES